MQPKQLIIAILIGSTFIALGLIPGVLSGLLEAMQEFRDLLSPFSAREPRYPNTCGRERLPGQVWLAVWGMALIVLSLFGYFSS